MAFFFLTVWRCFGAPLWFHHVRSPLKRLAETGSKDVFCWYCSAAKTRLDKSRPRFSPFVLRNRLLAFATYQPFLDYRRLANVPSMSSWKTIAYLCFGGRSLAFWVLLENNWLFFSKFTITTFRQVFGILRKRVVPLFRTKVMSSQTATTPCTV